LLSNNVELIEVSNIEWGCLEPLKALYEAYPNPLPYPATVAEFNEKMYLIDGAKRLSGQNTGKVLVDRSIKVDNASDQLSYWLKMNKTYREINLLERSVFLPCSYKNILELPLSLQHFIAVNGPSYALMSMLDNAPKRILAILDRTLAVSTPGNSTLKLLLDMLFDLSSRDQLKAAEGAEFFQLVELSGIKDAVNSLLKLRNPGLSKKSSLLKKEISTCDTKTIKIEHDESFEADHITIKANLSSADDVEKVIQELNTLKDQNRIKTILDIYES
jgi:hypothetical protein